MTEEKLYRVEEFVTTGWEVVPGNSTKLNKDQAKELLEELIGEGTNPNRLRAVPDTTSGT
jgi:hypothetical protein